ncbi:MAG: hypothetical protein ACTH8J_16820 [Specibacter sp.]
MLPAIAAVAVLSVVAVDAVVADDSVVTGPVTTVSADAPALVASAGLEKVIRPIAAVAMMAPAFNPR